MKNDIMQNHMNLQFQQPQFVNICEPACNTTKHVLTTIILLALSIALSLPVHWFGVGKAFLPIQLPLLIGIFFLPVTYILFLTLLIPFINSLLTGMPALFPALPIMVIEFLSYFLLIRYMYFSKRNNIYFSLIITQLCGRIITTIVAWAFCVLWNTAFSGILIYFQHLIFDFLPGIALQLLIVPILANKNNLGSGKK